jgi:CO dehydrogenase/acetyl-CoA synthase epsilon subunit
MSTRNTLLERVNAMDATNKALCLVGHAINLDKVLTCIAKLAPSSMLVAVCTHQQMTQMNDASFDATNHNAECNWHCSKALHHFFICAMTFGATPTNRTP